MLRNYGCSNVFEMKFEKFQQFFLSSLLLSSEEDNRGGINEHPQFNFVHLTISKANTSLDFHTDSLSHHVPFTLGIKFISTEEKQFFDEIKGIFVFTRLFDDINTLAEIYGGLVMFGVLVPFVVFFFVVRAATSKRLIRSLWTLKHKTTRQFSTHLLSSLFSN